MKIQIEDSFGAFAEDKTLARAIRETQILPALRRHEVVTLDFSGVRSATQSFLHALINEPLQELKEEALENLEFKNCSAEIKTLIEIVVNYTLDPPVTNSR